ncbi:hypothetical protein COX08_00015, partial [Candidatus Beckwithbacteria bacterium CG23_combo_of_CG06-09_8_20_14_all_34_8]
MEDIIHDLIIIGSGPAGYTAAIYAGRAALKPLLFSGLTIGGQLMFTTEVENFPGFTKGILGPKLMLSMREQAQRFETEVIDNVVDKVDLNTRPFKVQVGDTKYLSRSLLISTGAESITLNLPREKELYGRGISTCAVCDAAFYRERSVYVVGGGDSAIEDVVALTKFTSDVNLIVRRDELRASKIMQNRILDNPKVRIHWNTEVVGLSGDQKLESIELKNNQTGIQKQVKADGLFFAIGHRPNTELFKQQIELTDNGYILTSINGLSKYGELRDV